MTTASAVDQPTSGPSRGLFVSWGDPADVDDWSGTPYHLLRGLRSLAGWQWDSCHYRKGLLYRSAAAANALRRRFSGHADYAQRLPIITRSFARQVERSLVRGGPYRCVLCCNSFAAPFATPPGVQRLLWTDGTFASLAGFYPEFSNFSPAYLATAERQERSALTAFDEVILSSTWAADEAQAHYGLDPARIHVVPFGDNTGASEGTGLPAIRPVVLPPLRLLLIANDWQRKGGDLALAVVAALRKCGVATELTIIGRAHDAGTVAPGVTALGYLSKQAPEEAKMLAQAMAQAHFLLLPSRADCTPMVVAEANAHAIPVISTRVGGIPSLIVDGQTGFLTSVDHFVPEAVRILLELTQDTDRIGRLAVAARNLYETTFRWRAIIGRDIAPLLTGPLP